MLEDLKITNPKYVSYCDDALVRVKMGLQENNPFELLITDLSFDEDHLKQKINTGQALISAVRELQSNLKIIIFSVEKKEIIIEKLFAEQHINGYVKAIKDVFSQ